MRLEHKKKKNEQASSSWPVSYRWLAVGTIAVYTAIGSKTIHVAFAQDARAASKNPDRIAYGPALSALQFDIAPGPLGEALDRFERAAQLQVRVSSPGIRELQSPGVSGLFKPDRAMDLLLKDTGAAWRFTSARTIIVDLGKVSSTIYVTEKLETLSGSIPKYSGALRDIPQSIDVVPHSVIAEQNATTLRDTLRNVAGISLAAGEGGSQGDNLTMRGFTARNDLFIDGMRDFGSYYRDPFNVEEIEVLQGPSSMSFGRDSTGGVVNQATKAPGLSRFISGGFDFGADLTRRVALDVNAPVPQLGKNTAFRLNLMGNAGNVAGRDVAENRRAGVAPSLEFGLGTPTRLTLSYFHQNENDIPDYGIPWLFDGPAPVNRHNYYGFRDGNFLRAYDDIGTIKAEHDFSRRLSLRNQLRYANYVRDARITEAQIVTPNTVNRNQIAVNSVESYFDDQLDLTANFETGFLRHSVAAGMEAGREISDPVRPKYSNVLTTSLLNPNENDVFTGIATPSSDVHATSNSAAVYFVDTVKFARKWDLTGGIRWDRFNTHYTQQVAPASAFNRLDEQPTWRAGLVYHPNPAGSVYVSASTSFNPSAESLSLSASNANLPPEKNHSLEAGTKWDLLGGRLSLRGALFRTGKTNAREPDPAHPLLNVLAGNQRASGVEATVSGRITSRWEVLSGYAHLDASVVSSRYYPAAAGAPLANVPANTLSFWSSYRFSRHWEAGAGGNFVDSRTASSTAPFDPVTGGVRQVPSYWVFQAMASHPITEHVSIQANIYNIAGRYYYDQVHPAHIVPGPGRSALIGLKFKF
jgi:catecholate siderophore receptor